MYRSKRTTEIKTGFDGFINRLDIAKERFSELEDRSIKLPKLRRKQKKKE